MHGSCTYTINALCVNQNLCYLLATYNLVKTSLYLSQNTQYYYPYYIIIYIYIYHLSPERKPIPPLYFSSVYILSPFSLFLHHINSSQILCSLQPIQLSSLSAHITFPSFPSLLSPPMSFPLS